MAHAERSRGAGAPRASLTCDPDGMDVRRGVVGLVNRLLKPTGLVVVPRTDWVDAMLDRRRRSVPVDDDRRQG